MLSSRQITEGKMEIATSAAMFAPADPPSELRQFASQMSRAATTTRKAVWIDSAHLITDDQTSMPCLATWTICYGCCALPSCAGSSCMVFYKFRMCVVVFLYLCVVIPCRGNLVLQAFARKQWLTVYRAHAGRPTKADTFVARGFVRRPFGGHYRRQGWLHLGDQWSPW